MTRTIRSRKLSTSSLEHNAHRHTGLVSDVVSAPVLDGVADAKRAIQCSEEPSMTLHQLPAYDGVLVSIEPPTSPTADVDHVSVDVVLVIDVSGSMNSPAPVPETPGEPQVESPGLSILDLVKHSARTIIETMNEKDRLGIVTFSNSSQIVQPLSNMSITNKQEAIKRIESLKPLSSTNLWAGIRTSLDIFRSAQVIGNVQAMYVLTDGIPNHMCPQKGYVPKLQQTVNRYFSGPKPTIHTFGFGYHIKSDLMRSIAEVGSGTYSFIPDAGMIGTVFVHAVANLYSTFAWNVKLEVDSQKRLEYTKSSISAAHPDSDDQSKYKLVLDLGSLHYGQSRDITLKVDKSEMACEKFSNDAFAKLIYTRHGCSSASTTYNVVGDHASSLSTSVLAYHGFRHSLITLLHSLCPWTESSPFKLSQLYLPDEPSLSRYETNVQQLTSTFQSFTQSHPSLTTDSITSLLSDLVGEITLSISDVAHYCRWGRHYLPSLLHAHAHQICNSFKDPGPLQYGTSSPLFQKCRNLLDDVFDSLPPPTRSLPPPRHMGGSNVDSDAHEMAVASFSMRSYRSRDSGCIHGDSTLLLSDNTSIPIKDARQGMTVWTPAGPRSIVAVLEFASRKPVELCCIGDLWITPWHPICHPERHWVFPKTVAERARWFPKKTKVYSLLLEKTRVGMKPRQHAVSISGQTCVTLGHGLTWSKVVWQDMAVRPDVRLHDFFGDWDAVHRGLGHLVEDPARKGVHLAFRMKSYGGTGLICGFADHEDPEVVTQA